jgi:hypothetical protein
MTGRLVVKNWRVFQHYKDRAPAWIKLQKSLLDDYVFNRLPLASKALAPMIWLLASESDDGSVPADVQWISFRLRWPEGDVVSGLKPLIDNGFLSDASSSLADRYQDACLEKEIEKEIEIDRSSLRSDLTVILPEPAKRTAIEKPPDKRRGIRLPDDWQPWDGWKEFARKEGLSDDDARREFDGFKDYWRGVPGQRGSKLDWDATFRNRLRDAAARKQRFLGHAQSGRGRSESGSTLEAYQRAAARFSEPFDFSGERSSSENHDGTFLEVSVGKG